MPGLAILQLEYVLLRYLFLTHKMAKWRIGWVDGFTLGCLRLIMERERERFFAELIHIDLVVQEKRQCK